MKSGATWLTDHFLIAMPTLADPNFYRTVTYICEHNDDGAMGIVINQILDLSFPEVLQSMNLPMEDPGLVDKPVYLGGPVQPDRGFVLHQPAGNWESSMAVSEQVALTASRDIIDAIAVGQGPDNSLVALGYAGWGAGQLEQELADNSWLTGPADTDIIFRLPVAERWQAAASLLGVDVSLLSSDIGHA